VGSARFDTTPVDAVNHSAGGGSDPPGGSDDPLDDDPEQRFGDPVRYFSELEDLEEDIANHSSLELYRSNSIVGDYELNVSFPSASVLSSIVVQSDDELIQICRNANSDYATYAKTIIHLLRCRNIMFAVYCNCEKLIAADFGGQLINFPRVMQGRTSVAELVSYEASSIKHLAEEFDHALSRYLYQTFLSKHKISSWSAEDALKGINEACNNCLQDLGLWDWGMAKQRPEFVWYCASQALDLAVLSFAGAHGQNFSRYLGRESSKFDVPGPFVNLPTQFTLRQRHLQCLDNFFGGSPVWVFHPNSMANTADVPLYLSTNMRDFSHIWGPVWGISTSGNLKAGIKRYDVGGGSIYPWPLSKNGPELFDGEVFCHWVPIKETWKAAEIHQTLLEENDTLLIGAIVRLERNEMCQTTITDIEAGLQDANSLHDLRTSDSSYYVDATSSAISLGGWGFNISGSRQFKRRNGQTLKSALLERWSHERDGSRMIVDLVKGYGLDMSFCSLNAKRTRLIDLLRTKSMIRYLENFDWDDDRCARRVFEILTKGTINDLLFAYRENRNWRKDIRDAILLALRILAECSVDESSGDLSIPWISRTSAHSATFNKKNISWTGFLQDKRDIATFGLLANKCLSFNEEGGRVCGHTTGKPVLQTSLRINRKMQDNWMKLKQRSSGDYFWSISAIYKKLRFPLGSQGSLTALKIVGGALLMEWTSEGSTKAFFKKAIHWNEGMHHQEYIRAKWNASDYPIDIFIESKQVIQGSPSKGPNKLKKPRYPISNAPQPPLPSDSSGTQPTLGESLERSHERQASSRPHTIPSEIEDTSHQRSGEQQTTSRPHSVPFEIEDTSHKRSTERQTVNRTQPTVPVPETQPRPPQRGKGPSRKEISSDLGSDDDNPASEKNGWKWDKKFKLWRRHVYTDGELDYTTWSRNPEQSDD
jgi:hypothetical protein